MANKETVLGLSAVYLFGRLVSDLTIVQNDPDEADRPPRKGSNNFLKGQFKDVEAGLARIFSFSYEGFFYDLARPSLFLVHGGGLDIDAPPPADPAYDRLARSPGRISRSGVGRQTGSFSLDMRVWVYDKSDLSMRLDVDSGSLEHILLTAELDDDSSDGRSSGGRSSGGRSSGGRSSGGRSSGVMGRSSGWMPRRSGDAE